MKVVVPNMLDFLQSPIYKAAVKASFKKCDTNKDGKISTDELTYAFCFFYFKISQKIPGIADPPAASEVAAWHKKYDTDEDSELTLDEYDALVTAWVREKGMNLGGAAVVGLTVQTFILPAIAGQLFAVAQQVSGLKVIPEKVFLLGCVIASKFFTIMARRRNTAEA
ncbi:hypothetical protein FVE85_3341 [Porphyridium purpureum]|uniref:EF-hand domain-containing protein n=1 Tax=Porphyridium purpureum TaxID=35688 RepID=A0A5J4YW02_PORPP|nr:hypothetical protein FVE85_3341 [Porphyridium purpureum]|eukprot:POR2580..scf227_4